VFTVSTATAVALAVLGSKMSPVRDGKPEEFWKLAAGVDLNEVKHTRWGHAYYPDDGWVAYTLSHMHGSELYRVRESVALQKLEAVKLTLLEASELGEDTPFVRGFHEWQRREQLSQTPVALFYALQRAQREGWGISNPEMIIVSAQEETSFWQRWRHVKWYWANFVFEWIFFSGMALFITWPGIWGLSIPRWMIHISLAPLLFMLPVYLGYARMSYTSAGLGGGIVYPYLLCPTFGGRCNAWDRWLLEHCPQVLEPLSAPNGIWVSLSGMGMPGPTSAVQFGLLVVVGVVVNTAAWRWCIWKFTSPRQRSAKTS
jgi:hypothetical protein